MRGVLLAVLAVVSLAASAVTPQRGAPQPELLFAFDNLRAISSWLRQHGREGYIGADVADAMGIAVPDGESALPAWQRGFKNDEVLRVAQSFEDLILFMVQHPDDRVYFYLSSPLGGLQKAFVSIPSKSLVVPLERSEAELRFREEVLYWRDRSETR